MAQKAFSPTRRSPRFAPRRPVTVAISHGGVPTAYGVVMNLSESGACLQTGMVPRQRELEMMLSFFDGVYVQAKGRVVWSDPGEGLASVGVEFTSISPVDRKSLSETLVAPAFDPV